VAEPTPSEANALVEEKLNSCIEELEKKLDADVLSYSGYIYHRADLFLRDTIELRKKQKPTRSKLAFILETGGGYIEVVQRIVNILRKHYRKVEFYVPNQAMSAGTVLVMSGDAIHMDYYSVLGPIDPQLPKAGGGYVPALGYLKKYEKLMEKANRGGLNTAEVTYLCTKFDPAELYQYEHARDLSVYLLEQWLAKYKFRDWKKTKTKGQKVDTKLRKKRAREIAEKLNETDKWHTHGHGISMAVLRSKEIKLLIEDFGKDKGLSQQIRDYWALLSDHMEKIGAPGAIHVRSKYRHFRW